MFIFEADMVAPVAAVIFGAALVSSIVGFAFAALASAPLVFLLGDPVRVVEVMVACSIAIQTCSVWALRHDIHWRPLLPFVAAGAATVPFGVWLLTYMPPAVFALGLGVFLTAYAIYMLCRGAPPVLCGGWREDAAAGALGGLAGGLAGFPGSFVTVWCGLRGWTKERQRAVYQPYILAMQLEAFACLRVHSPTALGPELFLVYVPLAVAAAFIGIAVFRRLTNRQFSIAVNALLLLCGIALFGGSF